MKNLPLLFFQLFQSEIFTFNISRSNPACAVLNIGGNETIIVVGGFGAADETNKIPILDSVEIYNNATNAFEVCKWCT